MLTIDNQTPFQVDRALLFDKKGSHVWAMAIKATYQVSKKGVVELAAVQDPVCVAPVWTGEPGKSSLLYENELVLEHPGTDVSVVNVFAHAPHGQAKQMDVGVKVGALVKTLRVFGERVWHTRVVGLAKTSPQPFERIPLVWERSYGGTEILDSQTGQFASEPRNPVGRGFATRPKNLEGKPLPNLEDITHPISCWRSRPAPVGLGPIPSHWAPRNQYGGTYDEEWQRTRMPLWPADYDPRFQISAPSGLHASSPLQGGETVSTVGLTRLGKLSFRLPREHLIVETQLGSQWTSQPVQLERIILEPEPRKVSMIWGSHIVCGSRRREIKQGRISRKAKEGG